jgi:hypothetical protein
VSLLPARRQHYAEGATSPTFQCKSVPDFSTLPIVASAKQFFLAPMP